MTTASQQLAEHGISMELAHSWVIANFAHPAGVLAACAKYGVTNAMLGEVVGWPGAPLAAGEVKAFFLSKGLNSVILEPAPGMATVQAVTGGSMTEGNGLVHTVTLAAATTEDTLIPFTFTVGATNTLDIHHTSWGEGVVPQGDSVRVPAGVQVFHFTVQSFNDTAAEGAESYSVSFGGKSATGLITDNDIAPTAPGGSALLPSFLDGFTTLLEFNDRTGELSNEALRAKVMEKLPDTVDYWELFNPTRFPGSFDGVYTTAELGVSYLGNIAATAENLESLFFGTYFDIVQAIDYSETLVITTYFSQNIINIISRSEAAMDKYAALFVQAEADPALPQTFGDSYYIELVTTGLMGMAASGSQGSVFELLMLI